MVGKKSGLELGGVWGALFEYNVAMANTNSAKKAIRVQERRRRRNQRVMSMVKTAQKFALARLNSQASPEEAKQVVLHAISQLDKALAKGVIHRNKAARRKSRLTKKLNLLLSGKKAS
jgi:small subunit ribosomal protein S20